MSFPHLETFIGGAICMGEFAIAMAFFRHWRRLRDRLFAWFAAAFVLLAFERVLLLGRTAGDDTPAVYVTRLIAYLLIIFAVIDRNLRER